MKDINNMLLKGKPVVEEMKSETKCYIENNMLVGKTVRFFLLSDDMPSSVYVGMKKKFAEQIGLVGEIVEGKDWDLEKVLDEITLCNNDKNCLGMIVQLPLSQHLKPHQAKILGAVDAQKDLDGLGGVLFGKAITGIIDFLPATPKAVICILDYYKLGNIQGKTVMIIGQSNLVGKPLALECMKRGATVMSFNGSSDKERMKVSFAQSDIIVSATGVVHLVDESLVQPGVDLTNKVLIDVGRGIKDGKAVGDIDVEYFEDKVKAITPVPGGVGPVTVASLFHNLVSINLS